MINSKHVLVGGELNVFCYGITDTCDIVWVHMILYVGVYPYCTYSIEVDVIAHRVAGGRHIDT